MTGLIRSGLGSVADLEGMPAGVVVASMSRLGWDRWGDMVKVPYGPRLMWRSKNRPEVLMNDREVADWAPLLVVRGAPEHARARGGVSVRVLVTGSRAWCDRAVIAEALREHRVPWDATLVVGDCPTGVDAIVTTLWRRYAAVEPEVHVADWSAGGGPARNKAMVAAGADLCLAFIGPCTSSRCRRPGRHDSHGASGCAREARRAGIPTFEYRPQ